MELPPTVFRSFLRPFRSFLRPFWSFLRLLDSVFSIFYSRTKYSTRGSKYLLWTDRKQAGGLEPTFLPSSSPSPSSSWRANISLIIIANIFSFAKDAGVNEIERKKATTNIAQPYQDGDRGENLRPKIATMAAGRRTRAAPGGQEQARRDGGASN